MCPACRNSCSSSAERCLLSLAVQGMERLCAERCSSCIFWRKAMAGLVVALACGEGAVAWLQGVEAWGGISSGCVGL